MLPSPEATESPRETISRSRTRTVTGTAAAGAPDGATVTRCWPCDGKASRKTHARSRVAPAGAPSMVQE